MNLYIADTHFGHKNIIHHDHRPFADTEEMDEFLIRSWNNRVYDGDIVYILGDFAFRNSKAPEEYLRRLNGKKHLIIGNHDKDLLKNDKAMSYFESVNQILNLHDSGEKLVLCHYPIAEWDGYYNGVWLIYGHIHNNIGEAAMFLKNKKALNAGCMINNYAPVSLKELIENNRNFLSNNL